MSHNTRKRLFSSQKINSSDLIYLFLTNFVNLFYSDDTNIVHSWSFFFSSTYGMGESMLRICCLIVFFAVSKYFYDQNDKVALAIIELADLQLGFIPHLIVSKSILLHFSVFQARHFFYFKTLPYDPKANTLKVLWYIGNVIQLHRKSIMCFF